MTWETLGGVWSTNEGQILGNATVPADAPILPAQAFVDCMLATINPGFVDLQFADKHVTAVTDFINHVNGIYGGLPNLILTNNELPQGEIDSLLALYAVNGAINEHALYLHGGDNAIPTNSAANQNAWAAAALTGYVVKFNIEGGVATLDIAQNGLANLTDAALSQSVVNAVLSLCVANYLNFGITLDISGGTTAAPSGQGLIDKATLITAGGTVTTN